MMENLFTFVRTLGNQRINGKKFFTDQIGVLGTLSDSVGEVGTSGKVLSSTGTGVEWITVGSSDVGELNDLKDVIISTASTGQLLQFNGESWVNWTHDFLTTSATLSSLADVGNARANDGDILVYNEGSGLWIPDEFPEFTESDTLDSVTGRGASTANNISVGALTATSVTTSLVQYNGIVTVKNNQQVDQGEPNPTLFNVNWLGDTHFSVDGDGYATASAGFKTSGTTGFLRSDGSVDTSTYLTSYTESQTLDDVTTLGSTTTNPITVGSVTTEAVYGPSSLTMWSITGQIRLMADENGGLIPDQGDPANVLFSFDWMEDPIAYIDTDGKITSNGFKTPSGTSSGFLKADGSIDTTTYLSGLPQRDLTSLSDVTIDNPEGGDFLVYDEPSGEWINSTISLSETDTLDDVTGRGNTTANSIDVGGVTTDYVYFDTAVRLTGDERQGYMAWNADVDTVSVYPYDSQWFNIGQDMHWHVKNGTAEDIARGTVLMAIGTVGNSSKIEAGLMVSDGTVNSKYIIGVALRDIAAGEFGKVVTQGTIRGIDTEIFQEGDVLWCDPLKPGGLTNVEPSAPNLRLPIAFVVSSAGNGSIAVRITQGNVLHELHDVSAASPEDGDLLAYNSTNRIWENFTPDYAASGHDHDDRYYTETEVDTFLSEKADTRHTHEIAEINELKDVLDRKLESESDPIYTGSSWYTTSNNATNWDTAYGWGNHAGLYADLFHRHYIEDVSELQDVLDRKLESETDPIYTGSSWYTTTNNATNWDAAYGWGDHASEGYLTSYENNYISNVKLVDTNLVFVGEGNAYNESVDLSALPFQAQGNYLTAESDTLDTVVTRGNSTTGTITAGGLNVISGASSQVSYFGSTATTQYADIALKTNDGQGEIFRAGTAYAYYGGAKALNIWNSNGPISLHPNGIENVLFLSNAGNVGVNTTNPTYKLHVNGTFSSNSFWTESSAISYWGVEGTAYGYLTWDTNYARIGATGNKTLYLGDDNQITIIDGGNVGINGAPQSNERFSVNAAEGIWALSAYLSGVQIGGIHVNDSVLQVQGSSGAEVRLSTSGNATWNGDVLATRVWVAAQGYLTSETDSQELDWNQEEKTLTISNGNSVDLRQMASIQDVENYGFITTESDTLATVVSRGSLTSSTINVAETTGGGYVYRTNSGWGSWAREGFSFANGSGTVMKALGAYGDSGTLLSYMYLGTDYLTNAFRVYDNHTYTPQLGVNKTNPTYTLDVGGSLRTTGSITVDSGNQITLDQNYAVHGYLQFSSAAFGGESAFGMYGYYGIALNTRQGNGITLRGDSNNVGIGTTSPGLKLDVDGAIRAREGTVYYGTGSYEYISYSGTNGYYRANGVHYFEGNGFFKGTWDGSGNLGIGTTSPSYKLDVSSDVRFGGGITLSPIEGNLYRTDGALSYYSLTNGVYLNGAGSRGWLRLNASGEENYQNCIDIHGETNGGYIMFRTGNSTRVTIVNGGNVGIGTDNPSYKLDVAGTVNSSAYRLSGGFTMSNMGGYAEFNNWVHLPVDRGFFSSVNGAHIYPNNGTYGAWRIAGNRNGWNGLEFDASNGQVSLMVNPNSNASGFHNNAYGWQIEWNNGTLYCSKNSYGGGVQAPVLDSVNYTSYAATSAQGSNADTAYGWGNHADYGYWNIDDEDEKRVQALSVRFAGDVEVQGTFSETSARRYKENIVDLEPVTDKVYSLRPVRYNKIGSETQEIGLIAEEVAELFPEVVHYDDDGQPESLNYTRLSVLLLQTVKELSERIQKLENK